MAGFGSIFGRLSALFTAGAVGGAAADSVAPVLRLVEQHANERRAVRVVDPGTAADAAAQLLDTDLPFRSLSEDGKVIAGSVWQGSPVDFEDDAKRSAVGHERFRLLRGLRMRVPPYAEALTLWRRGRVDEDTVDSVLAREGIPKGLWPALKELVGERLDPETIANAVQQGFVPDADLLPGPVSGPPYDVPVTQVPLHTLKEFLAAGIDEDRARVLAELSGNPPAPIELANMLMREQIPPSGWDTGIREGRTKTKWSHALRYYLTHPLLTPSVEIRRWLKGWQDKTETVKRLKLYGYTPEQVQDWYEAEGRPAAPGQMATAAARGINGPDGVPMDEAQFLKGIRQSDIRPEWGPMLWHSRFLYPPLFQLSRLVAADAINADTAKEWATKDRYPPEVVDALHKYWVSLSGTAGREQTKTELLAEYAGGFITPDEFRSVLVSLGFEGATLERELHLGDARRNASMRERVVKVIGDAYRAHAIDSTAATAELAEANVLGDAAAMLIALWDKERRFTVRELSDAQVAKAGSHRIIDPAVALAELQSRGYSAEDAQHLIDLAP